MTDLFFMIAFVAVIVVAFLPDKRQGRVFEWLGSVLGVIPVPVRHVLFAGLFCCLLIAVVYRVAHSVMDGAIEPSEINGLFNSESWK